MSKPSSASGYSPLQVELVRATCLYVATKLGDLKDAYDLFYILRRFGAGIGDVVQRLGPLLTYPEARQALEILENDFSDHDGLGPMRVARFIHGTPDDDTQADVVGAVAQLLAALR